MPAPMVKHREDVSSPRVMGKSPSPVLLGSCAHPCQPGAARRTEQGAFLSISSFVWVPTKCWGPCTVQLGSWPVRAEARVGFCPASWSKKLLRCSRLGMPTSPKSLRQSAGEESLRTHLLFLQNSKRSPDKITEVCVFRICLGFLPASPLLAAASTSAESSNFRSAPRLRQQACEASGGEEGRRTDPGQ